MRAWEWSDLLRLLAIVGMAYGAYCGFKRMPTPLRYKGRRYYPMSSGGFMNIFGVRVKNPVILSELAKMVPAQPENKPLSVQ
jgi:hypothetical protein